MQINNINSQNFNGYRAYTSKMNEVQTETAHYIEKYFDSHREILSDTDRQKIDIVVRFFRNAGNTIRADFLDKESGQFFKTKAVTLSCSEHNERGRTTFLQRIFEILNNIYCGKITRPEYNPEALVKCQSGITQMDTDLSASITSAYHNGGMPEALQAYQEYVHATDDVIMYEF